MSLGQVISLGSLVTKPNEVKGDPDIGMICRKIKSFLLSTVSEVLIENKTTPTSYNKDKVNFKDFGFCRFILLSLQNCPMDRFTDRTLSANYLKITYFSPLSVS